ncbi:MAG: hypothetical protein ACREUG_15355, partial [Steroidobacteraceae bacterium]
ATLSAINTGASGGIDIVNDPTGSGSSSTTVDALQLTNTADTTGDVTFVATTGSVVVPDPATAAIQAQGGTIRMTADAGSLSVSSAATAGSGSVELIAKGASADLTVGAIDSGATGHVLLIAGDSVLGTGAQSVVSSNDVEVRYGIQNLAGQLSSASASQQLGMTAASGSQVALTVWAPTGAQAPAANVHQFASSLKITQISFPPGDSRLEQALYTAPFGATSADVSGLAGETLNFESASSFQLAPEARLAATDSSDLGHNVLYIDWASYNPNVSLFGTLNPAVCLPGDQRDEDASPASSCVAPPSQARLAPLPNPSRTLLVLTGAGWKPMPAFELPR